jgi:hypothetical protein
MSHLRIDPDVRTIHHPGAAPGICWLWHWLDCPLALSVAPADEEPALHVFAADGEFASAGTPPPERYIVVAD